MSTPAQIAPIQQVTLKKSDLDDDSLTLLNQQITNIIGQLNNLLGFGGAPAKFASGIDLGGARLQNLGDAVSSTDAVSQAFGNSKFGPAALAPALNALGQHMLQTYRQLGNSSQREPTSSFLNGLQSTAPTSNTSDVFFGAPSGGTVDVTVSSGLHQKVDSSTIPYTARTDTLALPTLFTITGISRSSGTVTVTTSTPTGLTVGDGFTISSVSDPSYDGTFRVLSVAGNVITYLQGGTDGSSSGGALSVGGVYYYTLSQGQRKLGLMSGYSADTWSNRVAASIDGTTIIAVVVTTNAGGDTINSAAGATLPVPGGSIPVIRRL